MIDSEILRRTLGLGKDTSELLASYGTVEAHQKGDVLQRAGEYQNKVYFLINGLARSCSTTLGGGVH